jgi:hypothetical protein
MFRKTILTAALALSALVSVGAAARADSTQLMTTFDVQKSSWYVFAGGVTALSGENLSSQDGWLGRLTGGYGQYRYNTLFKGGLAGIPTTIDGTVTDGDLMLGYQHYTGVTRVTGYIGGNLEDQELSPSDPVTKVHGSRGGLKGQGEVFTQFAPNIPAFAIGSYTTAFRTYYSKGAVGYNFGHFTLGPEVGFQGSQAYNEVRYGALISGFDLGFAQAQADVGGEHSNRSGASGAYAGVGFFKTF